MGQDFKFKIDEMRENNPAKQQQTYAGESHVRNVCFVQTDGKMTFLNYGYLLSGEYSPDESTIVLQFTSHTITLKGIRLETPYTRNFLVRFQDTLPPLRNVITKLKRTLI